MLKEYIITIGASAGGIEALASLVSRLPAGLPAAILVVVHIPPYTDSQLPFIISRQGNLSATQPADGEKMKPGSIYIAPPNKHMVVEDGIICLRHGPKVNHSRPAIDTLFRSAAVAYGTQVIGVVLSGLLEDGAAGLLAIKKWGGTTIIQDLQEAPYPDMPRNALKYCPIDYQLPVEDIAKTLIELVHKPPEEQKKTLSNNHHKTEVNMTMTPNNIPVNDMYVLGTPSSYTCPECHGALWEIQEDSLIRFRCRVGHAFGLETLSATLGEHVEEALWAAMRALEEKANLANRIHERSRKEQRENEHYFAEKAQKAKEHAKILKEILMSNGLDTE